MVAYIPSLETLANRGRIIGSLDKAGRDDMIQELSNLGQQLERIVLVSHQEEFANAFPNRYSFKLVDKASFVTLMEEDE